MSDRAIITPKVLRWARTTARMSVESAAAKIPVYPGRLEEWEEGKSCPTMKQAEILAKAYRRPLALFFLPEIPFDFQPLQDFRSASSDPLSTASLFIIREMQQKQAWIGGVLKENGEKPLPFIGRYKPTSSPSLVANDIINTIGIQPGSYGPEGIMKEWIRKSGNLGIFISRASFIHSRLMLDSGEMQGFAIADPYAPFIFINSEDWQAPQLFTLVHELAHLWIAASGISNEIEPVVLRRSKMHPTELFCNEVAASALMPADYLQKLGSDVFLNEERVFGEAKKLGVSSFALLVRAKNLDIISDHKYHVLKKEADEGFKLFLENEAVKQSALKAKQKEKKTGGPNANLLLTHKNGQLFTRLVIDAYRGGLILPTEASSLLNTAVNNFSKLEAFI